MEPFTSQVLRSRRPWRLFLLFAVLASFTCAVTGNTAEGVVIGNTTDMSYDVQNGTTESPNAHENVTDHASGHEEDHGDEHEDDEHGAGPLEVVALNYDEIRNPLIFTIVVLLAGISKIGYHHADFLSSKIPESCILILLGTVLGAIFHLSGLSDKLPNFFEPHEFFVFLLPPIILEAAYSLHDRTVLENIGSILLFAVVGTVLASAFLGLTLYGLMESGAMGSIPEVTFMQMMIFSSLIVAVDPVAVLAVFNEIGVNHVLYFMVFGESLLNDGVTVVLYKVFQSYNVMDEINGVHIVLGFVKFLVVCLGGLLLGVLAGVASAVLTKYSVHVKVAQPIIIFTMAYFGFLLAEMFEFSGIISIIGCGLCQVQYAFNNISDKSRTTIKYFIKVISQCNEIIIFLFLGLSIVNDEHEWNTGFTIWTIFFCLIFRFIIIFAMSALINRFDTHRVRIIGLQEQFMIAYGGLRGAVCFSLVALLSSHDVPAKSMFMTTTLAVILFTVFIQGITIKPLVSLLQIKLAPEKDRSMYCELSNHVTDHMMAGMEDIIGDHGRNHLREKLSRWDSKYFKPWLEVDPDPKDATLKTYYENLLLKEHYNYLKLSGAKTENMPEIPVMHPDMLLMIAGGGTSATQPLLTPAALGDETANEKHRLSVPGTPNIVISEDPDLVNIRETIGRRRSRTPSESNATIDAKGLRDILSSGRNSKMMLTKYDRNLTSRRGDINTEIRRQKTFKNRRLQRLFSESAESVRSSARSSPVARKRQSWSEVESQLEDTWCSLPGAETATERGKPIHAPPRHAATVDLGSAGVGRLGTVEPLSGLVGTQLDSVFEEDETAGIKSNGGNTIDAKDKDEGEQKDGGGDGEEDLCRTKSQLKRQGGIDTSVSSPTAVHRDPLVKADSTGSQGHGRLTKQDELEDMPLTEIKDGAGQSSEEKKEDDSRV